ncbi:MAG: penicillin-binding protein [Jatrophihabitans sp.]
MAASPERPGMWPTLGKLLAALLAAGILVAGLALPYVGGLGLVAGHEANKFQDTVCNLQESKPPQKTTLLARDGKTVLATLFSQDRVEIDLKQVPQSLQDALVATEDRRFFTHHGVDMRGLIRSAISTTSGDTQGGSTLTMQYVKQIRYYEAGDDLKKQQAAIVQNLSRKIEDAKCAIYIEETLKESKDTILQNYLNIAFFGENSYGIQTAARTYFNKPASKLTLDEGALLVGMLRAPSSYDPFVNRTAAKQRRDEVIRNLVAVHKLTPELAREYIAKPISLATDAPPKIKEGCANSDTSIPNIGFYCEYVRQWLLNVNGFTDQQLQTGGYKIVTTLDPKIQKATQTSIEKSVPAKSPYTAVLPVVDPKTGDVLAMAASKRYGTGPNETEQPLFTKAVASAASTYKLLPLLTALDAGMPEDWTLQSDNGDGTYQPQNCSTRPKARNGDANVNYTTNETLLSGTVKSSNTFFVGLADQFFDCDLGPIVAMGQKLGLTSFNRKETPTQTVGADITNLQQAQRLVLGFIETSPLEMAGAYAAVANGGVYNAPAPILSITDTNGSALQVKRQPGGTRVVAPQVADQAVQILQGDTQPGGTAAAPFESWYSDGGSKIAGKTGTGVAQPQTKNGAIWFAGMTPDLVGVSALINFDNPNAPQAGLPGVKNSDAYGVYASNIWLKALRSTLSPRKWTWEDPSQAPGKDVPDVTGKSYADATTILAAQGFKIAELLTPGSSCPSNVQTGNIAFYGPQRAAPGTTIRVCESLGTSQQIYVAPRPKPVSKPRRGTGRGSGSSSGSRPGSGSGSSSAPAPGRGSGSSSAPPPGRGSGNGGGGGNR